MGYLTFLRENGRFLSYGFLMTLGSSFGQTFFIALFGAEIRADFGLTHGDFGTLYLVATVASGLTLAWIGRHIDVIDLRHYSAFVCVALAAACVLTAVATSIVVLGFALFGLRLTGQGLMSHAAMTTMTRYFDTVRGKAVSVASLGLPTGEAALPLIGVGLIAALGWRESWLAIAAVTACAVMPVVLWLLAGQHERHRKMLERAGAEAAMAAGQGRRDWTRSEVLRDPRYYLIMPAIGLPAMILTGLFFHQVQLAASKGWSMTWLASCFVGFAAAKVAASLAAGPLVDRLGAARLLPWVLPPLAFALTILGSVHHPGAALVYMTAAGMTVGGGITVVGALWAELYGTRHLGSIRAMVSAIMVLSTAVAPAAMGWLIDGGISLDAIAIGCALLTAVSIGLVASAMHMPAAPSTT